MKRYQTAIPISAGATATVYRAFDSDLGREVALKFLHRSEPMLLARLRREVRALARVDHPSICRVYDIGEQDGQPYIAMQLIEGEELTVAAHSMSLAQKVEVMRRIADGMEAAHREELVHRDLKPANIMIGKDSSGHPSPVVVDFGLVQDASQDGLTREDQLMGTPPYMAPEQITGGKTDPRTDIYALGATFYEMLTGRPPLEGGRSVEILWRAVHEESLSLRESDPTIPTDLATIIETCLAKEPSRRYASAADLERDLARFGAGETIVARPLSFVGRLGRRIRRYRWQVAAIGLTLSALLGAFWFVEKRSVRAEEQLMAAERWASLGRDADAQMRAAYMRAPHDIRPDKALIEERIVRLESERKGAGEVDTGALHFALGAHFLVLERNEEAIDHLQRAQDLGFATAEADYALGLALGQQYERRLIEAGYLRSQDERAAVVESLERSYRSRVTQNLARGREIASLSTSYVEGLIALYEGRFDDALTAAHRALEEAPWVYEAELLMGDAFLRQGVEASLARDFERAAAFFEEASSAYFNVNQKAPSDPRAYRGKCESDIYLLGRASDFPEETEVPIEKLRDQAMTVCEQALAIDPERHDVVLRLATVWSNWAQYLIWELQPAEDALAKARKYSERAIALRPEHSRSYLALAVVDVMEAEAVLATGRGDLSAPADRAIDGLERALELQPNEPPTLRVLGTALRLRGEGEERSGGDGVPWLERSSQLFEDLVASSPDPFALRYEAGLVTRSLAVARFEQGLDARSALERSATHLREALKIDPELDWTWAELATTQSVLADVLALTETAPESIEEARHEALDAVNQAIERNPELFEFHLRKVGILLAVANHQLLQDRDPEAPLDLARQSIEKLDALDSTHTAASQRRITLELLDARWALFQGEKPGDSLRVAVNALGRISNASDAHALRRTRADLLIWQGLAAFEAGRDALAFARAGLDLLTEEQKPEPRSLLQRGAFHLLLALEGDDSALLQARADLEGALRASPWLKPEVVFFLGLVRSLERGELPMLKGRSAWSNPWVVEAPVG